MKQYKLLYVIFSACQMRLFRWIHQFETSCNWRHL